MLPQRLALPSVLTALFVLATSTPPILAQSTVTAGAGGETVVLPGSHSRATAVTPDGSVWVLARTVGGATNRLELFRSANGLGGWTAIADTPTADDGAGSLVVGTDCDTLHVAWAASSNGIFDAYYQEYDVTTATWIGQPQQLTTGTSANDQYYVQDIELTARGTVVVAISTHRQPPRGTWSSGWSAGLLVRPVGSSTFDPVRQVNTDTYGQRIDLQAIGEVVHTTFRTNTGLYGVRYRAFDTATGQFVQPTDVQVDTGTANNNCIVADAAGDLYVLYNGTDQVRIAHATAASGWSNWTPMTVAMDPGLAIGNVSNENFTLVRDGDNVLAVYSKTSNNSRDLFARVLAGGQFVSPEITLVSTMDDDRFARLVGMRNTQGEVAGALILNENRNAAVPGRAIEARTFGGAAPRAALRFGLPCSAVDVRTEGNDPPAPGTTFDVTVSGPANTPGSMMIGTQCLASPFGLSFLGLPGCALHQDTLAVFPIATPASGVATISLPIPVGFTAPPTYFQAFLVDPAANGPGIAMSNSLAAVTR